MSLMPYTPSDSESIVTIEDLMRAISSPLSTRERPLRTERINVAHVASASNRYAGEEVTLFTRVQAREDLNGFDLEIYLPSGFHVKEAHCLSGQAVGLASILPSDRETYVVWKMAAPIEAESEFEFCVEAVVLPADEDFVGLSRAAVTARSREHNDQIEDEETAAVTVLVHARYLRYLPALYTHDRMMNRFLMLFESFWEPINQQITNIDKYFDPSVTPDEFLPWLSSWIALATIEDEAGPQTATGEPPAPAVRPQTAAAQTVPVRQARDESDGLDADFVSGATSGEITLPTHPSNLRQAPAPGGDLPLPRADESTTVAALMPYQARQIYLPTPEGGLAPVRRQQSSFADHEEAVLRQRLAREPLILPSPAENARHLLRVAQQLHKRRGTRVGLQRYLEIYTATEVHVIEHRAENFVLSERGGLGSRVALGHNNHPHSFSVLLRFPVHKERVASLSESVIEKRKDAIRRRIIPIIEDQKPAHTTYTLQIEMSPV